MTTVNREYYDAFPANSGVLTPNEVGAIFKVMIEKYPELEVTIKAIAEEFLSYIEFKQGEPIIISPSYLFPLDYDENTTTIKRKVIDALSSRKKRRKIDCNDCNGTVDGDDLLWGCDSFSE